MRTVSLDGGKYEFVVYDGRMVDARRNGVHWPAGMEFMFAKAVVAMLLRIIELEDREPVRSPCTLENCGHMRQLDKTVDLLGMERGTRSVLDELRSRQKMGRGGAMTSRGTASKQARMLEKVYETKKHGTKHMTVLRLVQEQGLEGAIDQLEAWGMKRITESDETKKGGTDEDGEKF